MTKKISRKSKRNSPKPRASRVGSDNSSAPTPFVNKEGHVMWLSGSMTIGELLKMGVVEIHLAKPGTPLHENEWRDASPALPNVADEPRSPNEK